MSRKIEKGKWGKAKNNGQKYEDTGGWEIQLFYIAQTLVSFMGWVEKSADEGWVISKSGCLIGQSRCLGPM